MNIFVSNLSFSVESEDLKGFFSEYGAVASARVVTDMDTSKSRRFGYVEMPDAAAAKKAIAELDNAIVDNRAMRVTEARPREDRPARSGLGYQSGQGGSRFRKNGNSYGKDR